MQAISLTQPWAQLVVLGLKRMETRSWPTSFRGQIAIHASKAFPRSAQALAGEHQDYKLLRFHGFGVEDLPLGAIVGTITGCYRSPYARLHLTDYSLEWSFGDFGPDRWFWTLEEPMMIEAVPCRGSLKIWEVPESVWAQVRAYGER